MGEDLLDIIQEARAASHFRTKAGGADEIVDGPFLGSSISSAFERLARFDDSVMEVARLGFREVHDVCCGIDVVEDGVGAIDLMPTWNMDGSIAVRRMSVGRC